MQQNIKHDIYMLDYQDITIVQKSKAPKKEKKRRVLNVWNNVSEGKIYNSDGKSQMVV